LTTRRSSRARWVSRSCPTFSRKQSANRHSNHPYRRSLPEDVPSNGQVDRSTTFPSLRSPLQPSLRSDLRSQPRRSVFTGFPFRSSPTDMSLYAAHLNTSFRYERLFLLFSFPPSPCRAPILNFLLR